MICNKQEAPSAIQRSYLFRNFGNSELEPIKNLASCRIYEAGEIIFEEGSGAESFFIIGYGTVGLEINTHEEFGSHPVLLGTGETFGESHYHLREQHLATAKARERSEIYEISYDGLSEILGNNPTAELKLTKALALHLGRYCHHLIEGMMDHKARLYVNEGISSFV
jgi:CRP-like cAMP-binding protein